MRKTIFGIKRRISTIAILQLSVNRVGKTAVRLNFERQRRTFGWEKLMCNVHFGCSFVSKNCYYN